MFGISQLYIAYRGLEIKNALKRIYIKLYIIYFILGSVCWIIDQLWCTKKMELYKFHALWHIFTSLGGLFGLLALL